MPFIPHTQREVEEMLKTIGESSIESLFDEIPKALRNTSLEGIPAGLSEMELSQLMVQRAKQDDGLLCFIGAGSYTHHIPAAVWEVAGRGEFMTAYTPYQAEASQGSLQLIYEFQTMMASLMSLDVSNASMYDGATSLAESILMAVRLKRKKEASILLPNTVHPHYRETVETILKQQSIHLIDVPYDAETGRVDQAQLDRLLQDDTVALVIPQPNFFGVLEAVDDLTDWAKAKNIFSIAVVNPMAMAMLKPPGQWGKEGVDIACGEGQPLGIPMASGGPYYGLLCCKKAHVRQMPGRIVGRTTDLDGKTGYVLTLQAREQHIRRAKATSNICTNQGLMVTASTIFMSMLGPKGLRHVAELCHQRTQALCAALNKVDGVSKTFTAPYFHEAVVKINKPAKDVLKQLALMGIQGGYDLKQYYPELGDAILVCATEVKVQADIDRFAAALNEVLTSNTALCSNA